MTVVQSLARSPPDRISDPIFLRALYVLLFRLRRPSSQRAVDIVAPLPTNDPASIPWGRPRADVGHESSGALRIT
eukprot:12791605-Alexandrium_andersonii.AAC.1